MSSLEQLLLRHQEELRGVLEKRAGDLLRFESAEDLLQGLLVSLLDHKNAFQSAGTDSDRAWFFGAAKKHLAMRRRYWSTLKRDSGRLLRTGLAGLSKTGGEPLGVEGFAASQTGPSTFAFRREQLIFAAQALALLLPRDREIVEHASEGLSNEQIAAKLGIGIPAAAKARERALERLRMSHQLVLAKAKRDRAQI